MTFKKARDEARREWVTRLIQTYQGRDPNENELESLARGVWNDACDWCAEWTLTHHQEVEEMDDLITELEDKISTLEEICKKL